MKADWVRGRRFGAAGITTFVVFAGALFVAACGSSKTSSTTKTSANSSAIIQQARTTIAAASRPLHFTPPGPPIRAAKLSGKTIFVESVDQRVPTLAQAVNGIQAAAKVVDVKVTVFDAQAAVPRMLQGIRQAISAKASAIILVGIPITIVRSELATTKIPSIEVLDNDPIAGASGQGAGLHVYATSSPSYTEAGQLLAYKAILDTNGKADAVVFKSTSGADPSVPTANGIEQVLKQCSGCTFTSNDTPLQDWSTQLAPLAQNEIRRNPNVNYLLPVFDGMGLFVVSGVREAVASGHVKVVAFNGVPAALALVQKNDIMVADPGQSNLWTGWHAVDQAMRGMLGLRPANPEVPLRFFDSSNLKGVNVNDDAALYGNEYVAGYKKLWGLG